MLAAISEIYSGRVFEFVDNGVESTRRQQKAGIIQGCPLSPFLFSMVMTILMTDAVNNLGDEALKAYEKGDLETVLFADDMLLLATLKGTTAPDDGRLGGCLWKSWPRGTYGGDQDSKHCGGRSQGHNDYDESL